MVLRTKSILCCLNIPNIITKAVSVFITVYIFQIITIVNNVFNKIVIVIIVIVENFNYFSFNFSLFPVSIRGWNQSFTSPSLTIQCLYWIWHDLWIQGLVSNRLMTKDKDVYWHPFKFYKYWSSDGNWCP